MIGMTNGNLFEAGVDLVNIFHEQDGNTDITGDWIKLRDYFKVGVLFIKGGAEDVDDQGFQLLQATSAAGGSSKALNFPANGRIHYKTGTLTSQNTWTAVTPSTSTIDGMAFGSSVPTGFTRIITDVNTDPVVVLAEFETTALDVANGFDWFTVFVEGDNVNNALLLSCWAILYGNKYPQAIPLTSIA